MRPPGTCPAARRRCTLDGSAGSTTPRRTGSRSSSSTSGPPTAIGDQLLLLEHPAVLTLGRQSDPAHILASAEELAARGIAVERTERGGEVTYHGPGQLVAYPIIRLHDRGLLVRPLVRALEAALIATCAAQGVSAARRDGHPGCWCDPDGAVAAQDRGPGPARRARGQLPRHRPERHGRPRRLRAHRPVRDARRRLDVDRARARRADGTADDRVGRARRRRSSREAFASAIGAPLAMAG